MREILLFEVQENLTTMVLVRLVRRTLSSASLVKYSDTLYVDDILRPAIKPPMQSCSAWLTCVLYDGHHLHCPHLAGRYDEMKTVLQRMTNAPVYVPPELLVTRRPLRKVAPNLSSRWQFCRSSLGGWGYHSVSRRSPDDGDGTESSGTAMVDPDEDGSRDRYGHERHVCGGVKHVLCPGGDARLRRSTIVLVIVWFTISYGSYGVATWNNALFADVGLSNPYLCSFIYSLSNLPGNVGSILLVERVSSDMRGGMCP